MTTNHPLLKGRVIGRSPAQRGMALVVSLIFLLMLTLLGIASLSTNTAEERMTYAAADYTKAFQSADSAVSQGENWLSQQGNLPARDGVLLYDSGAAALDITNLQSPNWWASNGLSFDNSYTQGTPDGTSRGTTTALGKLSAPKYVLQYMGFESGNSLVIGGVANTPFPHFFRVTGIGSGVQSRTQALTQSIYAQNMTGK